MRLYDYLKANYKENEPILLSDIQIEGVTEATVRQQMKQLTEAGKIRRFDTGVYFIPKKSSLFRSEIGPLPDDVLRLKYLEKNGECIGYISGHMFANQIGVTTQVPMVYEVVSNKATKDYRETTLGGLRVVIRRPRVQVTGENCHILQFLDLLKDIDDTAEESGQALTRRLLAYMQRWEMEFSDLEPYLPYYPAKIYKNMYETRLLKGVSA